MKANKSIWGVIIAAVFFLGCGAAETWAQNSQETFYLRFTGLKNLKRGSDGTLLKAVLKKPETTFVQKIFAQRLADENALSFLGNTPLDTLWDDEVYALATGGESPSFVFAARLGPQESKKRFDALRSARKGEGVLNSEKETVNPEESWVLQDASGVSRAVAHGCGWLMYYTWTGDKVPQAIPTGLIHGSKAVPALGTNSLELRMNVDACRPFLGKLAPLSQSVSSVKLLGWLQGENVQSRLWVELKEEVKLTQNPWQFPTNIVIDPLVQLTALRGSGDVVQKSDWWKEVTKGEVTAPDQMYLFARNGTPFLTTLLAANPKPAEAVGKLGWGLTQWMTNSHPNMGYPPQLAVNTNAVELGWVGWPIVTPYLRAAKDGEKDYLMGGAILGYPKGTPLPPELWNAITKEEDTFLYSWEITGQRFPQLQVLNGLFKMIMRDAPEKVKRKAKADMTPEELEARKVEANQRKIKNQRDEKVSNWLTSASDNLGNCVTLGRQLSSRELYFERQSSCGLSALELWILGEWLMDR
ncbi:MAG: hypothetical protein M0Q48_00985 [Verrucomicrobia bacterium]|nr:hypothetical protein [Verrucomicrobiota bacterium]